MIDSQDLDALRTKLTTPKEETAASPSLSEMNGLAESLATQRDQKEDLENQLKVVNASIEGINKRVIDLLMENNIDSYKAPAGGMSITHRFTAALPQGENRVLCWEYLKSIGRWEDMASIHSQTFNSWVKEQYDLAKEEGKEEPKLPGVTDVKTVLGISFRRK